MELIEALEKQYCEKNYMIVHNTTKNGMAYVYCSSNALYQKGDFQSFQEKIIQSDRYEWTNLGAEMKPELEIYIRDIFLSWYAKGINSTINSYAKLAYFIKEQTKGYRVRFVGASSGGFIGTVLAMELNSEIVYSFAGQFSLKHHFDHLQNNPYLKELDEEEVDYWLEYYKRIPKSKTTIIYIYPNESLQDQEQYSLIKNLESIVTVEVLCSEHGVAIYPFAIPKFLSYDVEKARNLGGAISKLKLSLRIGGPVKFFKWAIKKIKKR